MPDIFLSYAREDAARAEQVAHALEHEGFDVFWDREIPPGVSWPDYIEEKLSACKVLVVLWSASSTRSRWVRQEARVALEGGKLLPAMLDGSDPPLGFGEVQAVNLAAWRGEPARPGRGSPQGVTGIGIVAYASGELYEGEYRSDAPLVAPTIVRHGLGLLHARGAVVASGRFADDAPVAAA